MSNLNKAFIAAYRKNTAPVKAPGPMRPLPVGRSCVPAAEARDPAASAPQPAETISTTRPNSQTAIIAAPAELPPPGQAHIVTEAPPQPHVPLVFPTLPAAVDNPSPAQDRPPP